MSPKSARAAEVIRLFELNPTELKPRNVHPTTDSISFELRPSATTMTKHELETCLNLIEETSGNDYRASSIGWNPRTKRKEMKDKEMMYLLIRKGGTIKRPRAGSDGIEMPSKAMKMSLSSSEALQESLQCNHIMRSEVQTVSNTKINITTANTVEEHNSQTLDATASEDFSRSPGEILGFLSFMFTFDDPPHEDREVVYIYEIHMHDTLRGCGIGSRLMTFVEQVALQCGINKTMLTVFNANIKARALYGKLGYAKDECSPKDRVVRKRTIEADYIIMSKDLGQLEKLGS